MERPSFYEDDEQEQEHEENMDEFFEEMQENMGGFIEMVPMEMIAAATNQKVLIASIRIVESNFWWRFRSVKTKIRMIRETYKAINQLLEG